MPDAPARTRRDAPSDAKPLSAPQRALRKLGLSRPIDLALHLPLRYEDETHLVRLADARDGDTVQVEGEVTHQEIAYRPRRQLLVSLNDGSDTCTLRFFNFYPSQQKQMAVGQRIRARGELRGGFAGLTMMHPTVRAAGGALPQALTPVYPTVAGLPQPYLRKAVLAGLAEADLSETLAPEVLDQMGDWPLWDLRRSLSFLHQPLPDAVLAELEDRSHPAWLRLKAEELLAQQLSQLQARRAREHLRAPVLRAAAGGLPEQLLAALPFQLTEAQRRVAEEIARDLAREQPMHRLLQGDVGAGKTLVAVSAMLVAVQGGHQAALMAPTEVLAEQHATGVRRLLDGVTVPDPGNLFGDRPLRVELLTNRVTGADRREVLAGLADGSVDIAIGTHALIQEGVEFHSLGVVVIDEQHRFGVEQRAALRAKSAGDAVPDVLVMTATPIPRPAAMTVYGDLDVSVLDELPPGRTPIRTHWANGPMMELAAWGTVREQVGEGRQAYVVCPLIEESEKLEVASAQETFERLVRDELKGLRLGLLHGRLPASEKEAVMDAFRRGDLDVLVATTVIEVGVDVPNATVMVILDADRFGIAQLHQLRGRVGRGAHESECWLVTRQVEGSNPRVEALVESTDGFHLAEVDLDLRGEGTLTDTAQKGRSDLKLASLRRDRELVQQARDVAFSLVDPDPLLEGNPLLLDEVRLLFTADDEEFLFKS